MKIFTLAALCLFAIGNLNAQWVRQNAPGAIAYLNSINFTNTNSGITTGWGIDLQNPNTTTRAYYTTNGGANWIPASVPDSSRVIASTQYITPQIVYGTGAINLFFDKQILNYSHLQDNGINKDASGIDFSSAAFFKSTDGGMSWKEYGSMPEGFYYATGIDFIDASTGITIGTFGDSITPVNTYVLKTTNGGLTWTKIMSDKDTRELRDLAFINENLVVAAGMQFVGNLNKAVILRTTNGGANWTESFYDSCYFSKINFINNTTGFATGIKFDKGLILRTTDAGNSWHTFFTRDSIAIEGINFFGESGIGIAYGEKFFTGDNYQPFSMRTTNFGENWSLQLLPEISNGVTLTSGAVVDAHTYYITGGTFQEGRIYHTKNGGITSIRTGEINTAEGFSLSQNFPNPFNPVTVIKYTVPANAHVSLKVYNGVGKEIVELVKGVKQQGSYEISFNAENLPSGVYYYKLISDDFSETKKMLLIK